MTLDRQTIRQLAELLENAELNRQPVTTRSADARRNGASAQPA